jgi:hypothetical protein
VAKDLKFREEARRAMLDGVNVLELLDCCKVIGGHLRVGHVTTIPLVRAN